MRKLLGSLIVVVALSFLGLPSVMAAEQTSSAVQKDGDKDKDKDQKRRKHRRHHHKHHHRHHKHTPPKTDSTST